VKSVYSKTLVWLRRDLRLHDHRAFFEATEVSDEVQLVFVIDEVITSRLKPDDRRATFIQTCLDELHTVLQKKGGGLIVARGNPVEVIPKLAQTLKASAVFFSHDYEPDAKLRDLNVTAALTQLGIESHSYKDQVIFERREILNGSNEPYRVFTPYSKTWIKQLEAKKSVHLKKYDPNLKKISVFKTQAKNARFEDLGFQLPEISFEAGEAAAHRGLKHFVEHIAKYQEARDYPAIDGTSSLSPHFRFGTLSIREAVRFAQDHLSAGAKVWLSELIWREFYMMILDQYPHVVNEAFRADYAKIRWPGKKEHFQAWCEGRTGFPLVDAAMRQLNETGWMHNRLRMVTAMFLTKDLLIDWRMGERYFAEKLLDYDLSANNGGWQWSASTGCDSQPYFRIMNPVSQSEKFDASGEFIRKFVPELEAVNDRKIHWPHDEGDLFSKDLNGYPHPIVVHKEQRLKALTLFKK
jgi:deoxyribodipyrimidine photo-lyase